MKNFHNIEKSGFRNEYVGWNAAGERYAIRKFNRFWKAIPVTYKEGYQVFYHRTLAEISAELASIGNEIKKD